MPANQATPMTEGDGVAESGRRVEPFAMWIPRDERDGSDPTRLFLVRGVVFVRFGIGGEWGCIGVEIARNAR